MLSNCAPRYTLLPTYIGHRHVTPGYERKQALVDAFFDAETPIERRREILRESGCRWVMAERRLSPRECRRLGLREVFAGADVRVYDADRPSASSENARDRVKETAARCSNLSAT